MPFHRQFQILFFSTIHVYHNSQQFHLQICYHHLIYHSVYPFYLPHHQPSYLSCQPQGHPSLSLFIHPSSCLPIKILSDGWMCFIYLVWSPWLCPSVSPSLTHFSFILFLLFLFLPFFPFPFSFVSLSHFFFCLSV